MIGHGRVRNLAEAAVLGAICIALEERRRRPAIGAASARGPSLAEHGARSGGEYSGWFTQHLGGPRPGASQVGATERQFG